MTPRASIGCVPSPATHPDCFRLLRLLADARIHSGRSLAAKLGCSRGSLSIRLRETNGLGLGMETVRGRGYRLREPLDLIDPGGLSALLAPLPWPFRVEVLDECPSTSTLLLERAHNGAAHASVLVCERQTAGRGRRGAEWISALGGSLTFSLLWRFRKPASELPGLSLAVAVGAARAIEALGFGPVLLKWPNDLLFADAKLGGILIETGGDVAGPCVAVIGLGLNVRLTDVARSAIAVPAAHLAHSEAPPSRTLLLVRLLEHLAAVLELFENAGFAALREDWLQRHAWQGRRVALKVADQHVAEGEAVGIAEDGALLLRSERGLERFHAGELSLRQA